MIYFYSVSELYKQENFTHNFLASFNGLTDSAKKIVLKNNRKLKEYVDVLINSSYPNLDFTLNHLKIDKIIFRNSNSLDICPIHNIQLSKKTAVIKIKKNNRKFVLDACPKCKAFYSNTNKREIKSLIKAKIDYELITLELILNEK